MRKKKQEQFLYTRKIILYSKLLLFCVPLALGMAGFQCAGGVRMADALYFCVCMYVLGSTTAST